MSDAPAAASTETKPETETKSETETETETAVSLVQSRRRGKGYVVETRTRRLNDLMFLIGWLELFNALDFPANVFNQRPVPAFAMALMITGGVLILSASCVAFVDGWKSWHNLRLLWRGKGPSARGAGAGRVPDEGDEDAMMRGIHIRAWIWVNRGELGWEFIDRALMDGIGGFGGLLVGIGTLLAPAGGTPSIFETSNLMSGYVGNGFITFYGLINVGWAIYLWRLGSQRRAAVEDQLRDPQILKRARHCFFLHQVYAAVYGVTVVVAAVGSMISATMWWGVRHPHPVHRLVGLRQYSMAAPGRVRPRRLPVQADAVSKHPGRDRVRDRGADAGSRGAPGRTAGPVLALANAGLLLRA
ncbi:hypothetical protein PG988_001526 [Apiospora saccharicola]